MKAASSWRGTAIKRRNRRVSARQKKYNSASAVLVEQSSL